MVIVVFTLTVTVTATASADKSPPPPPPPLTVAAAAAAADSRRCRHAGEQEGKGEDEGEDEGDGEEEQSDGEGTEASDGMNSSDDEDDTAERMDICGEAPSTPPLGYTYAPCPPLATEDDLRALKGRKILAAHILDDAIGWYMGSVQDFGVGPGWKQPSATHIIKYTAKETNNKSLNGRVASKLSADNYGATEWWILLDPVD